MSPSAGKSLAFRRRHTGVVRTFHAVRKNYALPTGIVGIGIVNAVTTIVHTENKTVSFFSCFCFAGSKQSSIFARSFGQTKKRREIETEYGLIKLIMPRTKEQYEELRREKRELIGSTALTLFAEKGYDATSINEIAQSAGISKGLMYNYFKSKEELLQSIWDNLLLEFRDMIDPNHDGEVTDREAEAFVDLFFDRLKTKRHIYKLYYQLSFQPKVVDFLMTKYNRNRAEYSQKLVIDYFSKKLSLGDAQINYFTALVFWKGLSLVTTYTDHYFDNDFLDKYKNGLKSIFFKNKSGNSHA